MNQKKLELIKEKQKQVIERKTLKIIIKSKHESITKRQIKENVKTKKSLKKIVV